MVEGSVTLAFRRWKRPTVKSGGNLRTAVGVLAIDAVDVVNESKITARDARQAGYASRKELVAELNKRKSGDVYRIKLRYAGSDPRDALRKQAELDANELADLRNRLAGMDARSNDGAWTKATLKLIAKNPGTRAPDLAAAVGMETMRFKNNVRKLKDRHRSCSWQRRISRSHAHQTSPRPWAYNETENQCSEARRACTKIGYRLSTRGETVLRRLRS